MISSSLDATTTAMKAWWLKAYLFSDTANLTGPGPLLRSGHGSAANLENLAALARFGRDARDGGHEEREP